MYYYIQTRKPSDRLPRDPSDWYSDDVGEPNEFSSVQEAEAVIQVLRQIGPEWAEAEYRVMPLAAVVSPRTGLMASEENENES